MVNSIWLCLLCFSGWSEDYIFQLFMLLTECLWAGPDSNASYLQYPFASNTLWQAWMLYYCPSVGTMVQYCHMVLTRHISYARVFAQWNGFAGNLQGKYNAGNQPLGVLSMRSFPAQVLCNVAWIPL